MLKYLYLHRFKYKRGISVEISGSQISNKKNGGKFKCKELWDSKYERLHVDIKEMDRNKCDLISQKKRRKHMERLGKGRRDNFCLKK